MKYYESMDEMSKKIDDVIEQEKEIKAQLPAHPRFTPMREELDRRIKELRWLKKSALKLWREAKRNPVIKP